MTKATKETTVKDADKKAQNVKNRADCEKAIIFEAMRLFNNEEHSVQQLYAYCRQLKKVSK